MKNYFIVGGSSGIGRALANQLATEGHRVFATFNANPTQSPTGNLQFHFLDARSVTPDLSFLPNQLDGFVYCPGSINLVPFARIKPEDFTSDFEFQVTGAIRLLQMVLPKLKASGKAAVLFFSTVAVQTGFSFHSQVAASKGALEGLTRALAAELAPTIRVNTIAPSITDTPLTARFLSSLEKKEANAQRHPLKKIGNPENLAQTASFLLSDQASWITGQILAVDGGMSVIAN